MVLGTLCVEMNLTTDEITKTTFSKTVYEQLLGGRGLNVKILNEIVSKETQAFDPENIIVFSTGLLVSYPVSGASRLHISSISPQTNFYGSSNVGGDVAVRLASCGIKTLILKGKSINPAYLLITPEKISLESALPYWGKTTLETHKLLEKKYGKKQTSILTIGPAGEELIPFSCIIAGSHNAAGRTGMGAVLGSKNIKAIVIQAPLSIQPLPKKAKQAIKTYLNTLMSSDHFKLISTYGGAGYIEWCSDMGMMSSYNYKKTQFSHAKQIDSQSMHQYFETAERCFGCPIHCKATLKLDNSKYPIEKASRPEFEPTISLGSKCGVTDPQAVIYLHNLCNELGLDGVSTGSVIAFAMDLYERGILTKKHTKELDLEWGNVDAMIDLINKIVWREGIGNILSNGVKKAAQEIGHNAENYAYHVKGLELSGYDPRAVKATALGYAISQRGGDFSHVYATPEYWWTDEKAMEKLGTSGAAQRFSHEGKAVLVKRCLIACAILDSLGLCKIPVLSLIGEFDLESEAAIVESLTSIGIDSNSLLKIGQRIITIEQIININRGASQKDDQLPEMFCSTSVPDGPAKGNTVKVKAMVKEFYKEMGWNDHGIPTEEIKEKLNLT